MSPCLGSQGVRRQGGIQLPTVADLAGLDVTNSLVPGRRRKSPSSAAQTQAPVTVVISRLAHIDVLAIDDWAMTPLSEPERHDFWEICKDHYLAADVSAKLRCGWKPSRPPRWTIRSSARAFEIGEEADVVFLAPALSKTGTIVGAPDYMSPEQVKGEPLDRRAPVRSAGKFPSIPPHFDTCNYSKAAEEKRNCRESFSGLILLIELQAGNNAPVLPCCAALSPAE